MDEESAFLRKLLEQPNNDLTRLVYADWLDEQGTPESIAKAEFLRLIADAELDWKLSHRVRELARQIHSMWLAAVCKSLTVLIGGQPVGAVLVTSRSLRNVFGMLVPLAGFEPYRSVFEAAVELDREFAKQPGNEPCNYLPWDQLVAAWGEIDRLGPTFAELPGSIEEFTINGDWSVEILLESFPRPEAWAGRDSLSG